MFLTPYKEIAARLLANGDRGWQDPNMFETPDDGSDDPGMLKQDGEIFDTARRINCIHFKNIVVEDFLKGLLGIPLVGGKTNLDLTPVRVLESCFLQSS